MRMRAVKKARPEPGEEGGADAYASKSDLRCRLYLSYLHRLRWRAKHQHYYYVSGVHTAYASFVPTQPFTPSRWAVYGFTDAPQQRRSLFDRPWLCQEREGRRQAPCLHLHAPPYVKAVGCRLDRMLAICRWGWATCRDPPLCAPLDRRALAVG